MNPDVPEAYRDFWNLLPKSIEANLKFAKAVINFKDPIHSMYFWGEYSKPILAYIIINALKHTYASDEDMSVYAGDYKDFVMGPFDEKTGESKWYQLKTYRGENGKKLKGWLQKNGYQYFIQKEQTDEGRRKREGGTLNKLPLDVLLCFDSIPDGLSDQDLKYLAALKIAWGKLSTKNKEVLRLRVISKTHWTEAWDKLHCYVDPDEDKEPMSEWSNKKKQNSIARLKRRAKEKLRDTFYKELNNL
jgi:hypothetical protein